VTLLDTSPAVLGVDRVLIYLDQKWVQDFGLVVATSLIRILSYDSHSSVYLPLAILTRASGTDSRRVLLILCSILASIVLISLLELFYQTFESNILLN